MPSGTARFGSVCQPALSSPSTMTRSRPAPASRANKARSAAKNGLDTPFDTYQKVSPERLARDAMGRTVAKMVDSSGCRNTAYVTGLEELVQSLGRCPPAKGLSRPAVEGDRHGRKVLGTVHAEVSALREVLAQQPIGVLIRAALPGAVGIA